MGKSWLMCVLLGTLAWGQAAPATPPAPKTTPGQPANQASAETSASVPEDASVLTINGVCPAQPKTAASTAKSATGAKPAAKTPADCKTIITKAKFEKLAKALSPDPDAPMSPQLKRQLGGLLPGLIAMSEAAKKKHMDQTPEFKEVMWFMQMQVLRQKLQQQMQKDAAKVPSEDIEKYYNDHSNDFEQFNVDRIFVPRTKQAEPEPRTDADQKLTEEQQKAKQDAEKAKAAQAEQDMTKLADDLQKRAAAGEDFTKLQKEAFAAAGMKIESPNVSLTNIRRTGVPPGHAVVFDLKPGEVSQVISDAGGHYIYKLNSKSEEPLDQAQSEIRSRLQNERIRDAMEKLNGSYKVDTNEAYFGPGGTNPLPSRPGMGMGSGRPAPGGMGRPAPPSAPSPQPQSPPQQAPEQKPN